MKGGREGVRVGGRGCDGGHLEELHPLAVAVGEGAFQGRGQLAGVHVLAESLQGGHHLYLQMEEASQEDQRWGHMFEKGLPDPYPTTTPPATGKAGPGFKSCFLGQRSSLESLTNQHSEQDPGLGMANNSTHPAPLLACAPGRHH